MKFYTLYFFCYLAVLQNSFSQSCPGCVIDESYISPGVYPTSLPSATAGEYYETDLTFVLQEDTTIDLFGTFEFLNYYIMSPLGMPYGLHATSNLGEFPVNYDPDESLYGCVKVCGTPLIAGTYTVIVPLIATLEDPAGDQPAEYELTIEVLPAAAGTGGFTSSTLFGCSPLTVDFSTEYPSGGADGFSYFWDFGNGFTSIDEHPSPQIFTADSEPQQYIISHTVTIDTVGYSLDYITITGSNCDDCAFFGCTGVTTAEKPDLYLMIDALGINTFPGYADTDPPVTFILNTEVDPLSSYLLAVKDDDAGPTGDDDNCGSSYFDGGDVGITSIDIGASNVDISISHPVLSFTFYDTIIVYPNPPHPELFADGELIFCEGDSVMLSTDSLDDILYQWYHDSAPIVSASEPSYLATESGDYFVTVTAEGGCSDSSDISTVTVYEYPPSLVIVPYLNTLTTDSEYDLQWYYEGSAIPGATNAIYTPGVEGSYSVSATNEICTVFSPEIEFIFQSISQMKNEEIVLYPNPTSSFIYMYGNLNNSEISSLQIRTISGALIFEKKNFYLQEALKIDISAQPEGLYFITLKTEKNFSQLYFTIMN